MGFPIRKATTAAIAGNLDTLVAGTRTGIGSVDLVNVAPGSLVAELTVDAETSTLTISADWQVSDDGSTWILLAPTNNAANVVIATGTGGADAAVTVALPAPEAAYSFRKARVAIRNGITTGAAVDTYSVRYHYLKPSML